MSKSRNDYAPDSSTAKPATSRENALLIVAGFAVLGVALFLVVSGALPPADEAVPVATPAGAFVLPPGGARVGEAAPLFVLPDAQGNRVALADFAGRPVIINFWATWCPPCLIEMPALQQIYEEYQEQRLAILAVNQDEPADVVTNFFYEENKLSFIPLLDQNVTVGDLYGAYNLPMTVFVNGAGIVTTVHRGLMSKGQMEASLADAIGDS